MNDPNDKNKRPGPRVEVIRKGPGAPVAPRPVAPAPAPRPVAPTAPVAPRVVPVSPAAAPARTVSGSMPMVSPRPGMGPVGPRPSRPGPPGRGPPRAGGFRGPSTPRPPPTPEAIVALAKKERVPNRIAKGELEGKMKCRIWKKLHAEEARRFDQAFTLLEQHPTLELTDAFGVVQSGLSVDEFLARRARAKKRDEVKKARSSVDGAPIDAFIQGLIESKAELSIVLGERTTLDLLTAVQPVSFEGERSGRLEKIQVVLLAHRATWEALANQIERDPRLAQKPTPVARQPSRRPVNDPRPMVDAVGKDVKFVLRNGITVTQRLNAVGPYDVLVGDEASPLFIPLHAMLSWTAVEGADPG
ncbi:MAG: hypothetical protein SFW67_06115 [Myxococcaceae bacterium]|nr:hypothetical protein [Myxococcaceae bacterium]